MIRKKFLSISFVLLLFCMIFNAGAVNLTSIQTIDFGDGYTLVINTTEYTNNIDSRSVKEKYVEREAKAYYGSTYLGKFTLCGTFIYNGSQSAAKSDSWYASSSYGYSGSSSHSGSKLSGKCTFNYSSGKTYSLTMTCDKNGNMSYT